MSSLQALETQIGQLLMVGFEGETAPPYLLQWLKAGQVGGIILFARNVESPHQLATLTRQLHDASLTPLLIAIDQEGGKVARLRQPNGFTESPGAMNLAAAPHAVANSREMSAILASEMRQLGINWTYAPVVDLTYNAENPTVGTRSYGDSYNHVSEMASAAVEGFQGAGIAACAKHFPGLGNTAVDSHLALPRIDGISVDDLLQSDLIPYRAVQKAGIASVMTTHTLFTTLDDTHPATLSPHIIERLLRDELGFDGVVTTDCLEMKAIADHYSPGESAVMAIQAGVDIVLFSHTPAMQTAAFDALLSAAKHGTLPTERIATANRRIAALKAAYQIDPAAINPNDIGTAKSQTRSIEIAHDGIVTYQQPSHFPQWRGRVGLVEFIPYQSSEVMETAGETQLSSVFETTIQTIAVHSQQPTDAQRQNALELAANVDMLIVATRNAHLLPNQRELAAELLTRQPNTILAALRNPYDAAVLTANTVLCTCGDSYPALVALARAIQSGQPTPGKFPVSLEVINETRN